MKTQQAERLSDGGSSESAREITFSGSRHEAGRQHGQACTRQIREELTAALARCGRGGTHGPSDLFRRVKAFVPWIRRHLPGYLDEVAGLGAGAGIGEDAALFLAVSDGLLVPPQGDCTSLYAGPASTVDGQIFLGQTKDTPAQDGRYSVMRWRYREGLEMILLNYAGWLANIGITSRGLALCGNSLYSRDHHAGELPFSLLKRACLESRTAEEARQFAEAGDWPDGFLAVADRGGSGVFIELVSGMAAVKELGGGCAGHANTILSPEHRHLDRSPEKSPTSKSRQVCVDRLLAEGVGAHSEETLRGILCGHTGHPGEICRHAERPSDIRTTAAVLASPSEGWLDVGIGYPCQVEFFRYQLPPEK